MPDYNLSGLSTRSFEQLIQAIAAKVIGPGTVIFGDGRDGGREATFEGTIDYAPRGERWSGYGVIQAKFKQRPESTQIDGSWALKQLRSEFEDFLDSKKGRRSPDYYIFATNVVLTPFLQKGAKDRIDQLFEEYSDRLHLTDYDVWDYDKLRVYLDDNEDIRHAYAAWITPGDVLAKVMEWLKPSTPDFEKTISRFLQEELLADQYANLEQAGHASDDRIPIARVFVDLPTFDKYLVEPPDEQHENLSVGLIHELLNIASARLDSESNIRTPGAAIRKEENQHEPGRVALIGGPGQGKTTMGQYVCQLYRAAILNERPEWSIILEARKTLQTIQAQCAEESISLPSVRRFPVRIVLNQFAKALAQENGPITSLLLYIVDRIKKRTDQEVSPDDFRKWLESYPWILVLDGLDEVPASSNREQVLNALRSFRMEVSATNADLLILATTRPQGYSLEFGPARFKHTYLAPLSAKRALYYANRLVSVRHSKDQDRKDKILSRLERASHQPATVRLMRSPLQVTIMATLVDRMGQPPQERWNLFKEYYNVIYQREVERDIPAAAILREHKADVDTIHKHAGLLLQVETESRGTTDARLSEKRFASIVETRLADMGHEPEDRDLLKRRIIEAATHRLVFLVGLEADEIGFEIRSLQEYMAAEGLMAGSDLQVRDRLKQIASNANWRNVFLFATGKCSADREDLLDTIYALCMSLNDDPTDDLSRVTLAGSQLALDILEDTPIRQQPKNARSLARIALRMLDLPPQSDQARLAGVYDSVLESVFREELLMRLNQLSFANRLGAFTCLITLIDSGVPWAEDLGNTRWPTRLDCETDLWALRSILHGSRWIESKLPQMLPRHRPSFFYGDVFHRKPGTPTIESGPEWFSVVDQILSISTFEENSLDVALLAESSELQTTLQGCSISEKSDWLKPLSNMPNPSAAWRLAVSGARLLNKPCKESLAAELRSLAADDEPGVRQWWDVEVPWPLSSCSAASSNSAALMAIADRVDSGEFGDLSDWLAAERRWEEHGITKSDVKYAAEGHWPFDSKIATRGFPFAACFPTFNKGTSLRLINELVQEYEEVKPSEMKSQFGKWLLWALILLSHGQDNSILQELPLTLEEFENLIGVATWPRFQFNLNIFARLQWEEKFNDQWALFFDKLGRSNSASVSYNGSIRAQMDHLASLISDAFARHPERTGLLRLLSTLAEAGASFHVISELLIPDRYSNNPDKLAAIQTQIMVGEWVSTNKHDLAQNLSDILGRDTSQSLKINPKMVHGNGLLFLVELLQKLSAPQWRLRSEIIAVFDDALRRRNSRLNIPEVWASVKLPLGLTTLLPNPGMRYR